MNAARVAGYLIIGCAVVLARDPARDYDLLARIKTLKGFTRVTNQRVVLPEPIDEGCVAFEYPKVNHTYLTRGGEAAIHVYVTGDGYPEFQRREGVFPEGTIILKEKFPNNAAKVPELYTGMIKREKG